MINLKGKKIFLEKKMKDWNRRNWEV